MNLGSRLLIMLVGMPQNLSTMTKMDSISPTLGRCAIKLEKQFPTVEKGLVKVLVVPKFCKVCRIVAEVRPIVSHF